MIRGTTPTLTYTLPFEIYAIKNIWITFSQNGVEIFTIDKNRCFINGKFVTVMLSQEETLRLTPNSYVDMQIRILSNDDVALASYTMRDAVNDVQKGGVIQ